MEQMARHYSRLLQAVLAAPETQIRDLEILAEEERRQLLVVWNATEAGYSQDKCLHHLLEEQAARTPEEVAVSCGGQQLTYAELNQQANQLAHYLRTLGAGPETRVAICLERSLRTVVALLGVLKAGAAYVPLDPAYPQDRLNYMLGDSDASLLVTESKFIELGRSLAGRVVLLDNDWPLITGESHENPRVKMDQENLAYVIYTSGSTGRPKGVAICHRSAVAFLSWAQQVFNRDELTGVLASTSICFDLSVFEIFVPLSCGERVIMVENALELARLSSSSGVTLVNTVPSAISELLRANAIPETVRTVNLAGEALQGSLVRQIYRQPNVERVLNLYGPTEDTTYSTYARMRNDEEDGNVSIGSPIANTHAYVLDDELGLAPVGVVGELYLGGDGLARGYLNRPELTAERFVPDPFSAKDGGRLYSTGDLVRYRVDGQLEFLGRRDHQVKIRGFRIELGEIESALKHHAGVEDSLVMAREDASGNQSLVGYVVRAAEAAVDGAELRRSVRQTLPEYMVPSTIMVLPSWPLTQNGKLDRRALPAPEMDFHAVHGDEPPQGDVETMLAAIWAEALRLNHVNRHDDFFRLGGHSLLTLRVVRLLQERGFIITVADMFANPTIESLAAKLKTRERPDSADIATQINGGGTDRPLFLAHCGNGELLYASALASHIDRNIPVYGLPAMPADQVQPETIEEMATRMVRMIRSVQPAGPYRIAGWSTGGTIAYEIATQLIGAHEQVEFIAMFDTYCPRSNSAARRARIDFNDSAFLLDLIQSAGTEGDGRKAALDSIRASLHTMDFADVVQECDRLSLIPDTLRYLTIAQTRLKLARTHSLVVAAARYQPHPLHIPVHFFPALDAQDSGNSCPHRGWNDVVPSDLLRITPVSGSHHSMLRSPNVELLGRSLTQAIIR
jgi:amino acid adenylation domain-containing protein